MTHYSYKIVIKTDTITINPIKFNTVTMGGGQPNLTQFMPIPHSNLKIGIGINWVKLAQNRVFLTEFNMINRCLHWLHQWCFTATPLM